MVVRHQQQQSAQQGGPGSTGYLDLECLKNLKELSRMLEEGEVSTQHSRETFHIYSCEDAATTLDVYRK